MIDNTKDRAELLGNLIDVVEDFLEERGITFDKTGHFSIDVGQVFDFHV